MKKYKNEIIFVLVVIWLVFIDLLTKKLIPTEVRNFGISWGFWYKNHGFLIVLTGFLACFVYILWHFFGRKSVFSCVAFGIFLAGALGNIYDRIVFGYVRDFISLPFWPQFPVFNFADICLTTGTIMLGIYYIFLGKKHA
jgi:signal peptidase II